ncbi:MAG: TetR/AcrR family transcriptional regulator [Alcanivoracaceae bacterium]
MTNSTPPISLAPSTASARAASSNDQVLDAALGLFIEFGLRRTSMDDVARKAGMGRATVYRRFGDKDQLVQAVILRECQQQLALIEERLQGMGSTVDAMVEAFVLAVTRAHRHPLLVRLLHSEPDTILPYLTVALPQATTTFARLYLAAQISKAQKAGQLAQRPAEPLAELLLRLTQSLVLSPAGIIDPADEDSVRQFANALLRPLLAPTT